MTSTLRTVTAAGEPGFSTLEGPEAFNLTLAGVDQSWRGGGHGLSSLSSAPARVEQGELCVGVAAQLRSWLSSELPVPVEEGPSFTPLIRLLRCFKSSGTLVGCVLVWIRVFLVGRRVVLGITTGLRTSGGLTGCCLERAT